MNILGRGAFFFIILYSLFFLQYPLSNSLPGNCDTLFAVAYSNIYRRMALSFFFGDEWTTSMFPQLDFIQFGETAFGSSLLFLIFKIWSLSDLWSYYFFIVTIFTLNAITFYRLAQENLCSQGSSLLAGLAFSGSNFTFGNIDSPHTLFFGIVFLSLIHLRRYLDKGNSRDLLLTFAFAGVQIYFAAYNFLFLCIVISAQLLVYVRSLLGNDGAVKKFIPPLLVFTVIILPFGRGYWRSIKSESFINPWNPYFIAEFHSLDPADLLKVVPGNIYNLEGDLLNVRQSLDLQESFRTNGHTKYAEFLLQEYRPYARASMRKKADEEAKVAFSFLRRCAFLGFFIYPLFFIGILSSRGKFRMEWGIPLLMGLALSMGPLLSFKGKVIPGPMWPFYEYLPWASFFRVPSRAFFMCLMAIALFAAKGMDFLIVVLGRRFSGNQGKGKLFEGILVMVFILIFLVENFPVAPKKYRNLTQPSDELTVFFQGKKSNILDLPSDIGLLFLNDFDDFFSYGREILYMNWQTYHQQNTLNGVHGYFPLERLRIHDEVQALPNDGMLEHWRSKYQLEYIVFHKNLRLPQDDQEILPWLLRSPRLKLEHDSADLSIFKLH